MEKFLLLYFLSIQLISIFFTILDKYNAKHGKFRIRERTLLLFAALGGAAGMLAVMLLIRHKTRHKRFMIGLPVMLLLQIGIGYLFTHFL